MHRSLVARALSIAALTFVAAGCGPASSAGSPAAPSAAAATTATPRPSANATASPAATTYDTTSLGANFDLPMTVTLPPDWQALPAPEYGPAGAFGFVHVGTPANDYAQWWGPGLFLVGGGSVLDAASMNDPSAGVEAKRPWPSSYLDYLASLPGVSVVSGPEPITIGGVSGRRIVIRTPAMHPTMYLKDDTTWIGGGKTGIDPALQREDIEMEVDGKPLILEYVDDPARFDEHDAVVDAIYKTIQFPGAG
jgi:hypothetical protein